MFPASPGQDATLSRGQFFAVLRLVLHVRGGAELDRNLVFKQGSSLPFTPLSLCPVFLSKFTRPSLELVTGTRAPSKGHCFELSEQINCDPCLFFVQTTVSALPPLQRVSCPSFGYHPCLQPVAVSIPHGAYDKTAVHLNPSHNEPASPTRPVNDRPSRSFPAPPRRRQASAGTVFDAPTSDTSTNPFLPTNHVHDHPQPPIHPDLRTGTVSSPTIVPAKPQPLPVSTPPPAPAHHASNPFVYRTATVVARSSPSPERRLPPLPPRKVPPVLPPRSFPSSASTSSDPSPKPHPPQVPTKVPHLTSALMQQSLQASKAGQEAKRIEAQREQERVLQVLKSSARSVSPPKRLGVGSSGSSHSSVDGAGATIPVLPPRRHVSPPASVASTRSFEQVAGASLVSRRTLRRSPSPLRPRSGSRFRSRSPSPSWPTTDLPPPMHPNRKTSTTEYTNISASPAAAAAATSSTSSTSTSTSTTSSPSSPRFGRSMSVDHSSPPPIPRRRRPDSVQVLQSPAGTSSSPSLLPHMTAPPATAPSPTFGRLSRHLSLSARESRWDDMRDTISAVRYKAEAGISRRGWVPGLERDERLITERRESGGGSRGGGVASTSSSEDGLGVDGESPAGGARRRASLERDQMKWPAGDGWSPLA